MTIPEILASQTVLYVLGAISAVAVTLIATYLLNRRSLFTYQVTHEQIIMPAEPGISESIKILLNSRSVPRVYCSILTLTNRSLKDFENVEVRIVGRNIILHAGKARISGNSQKIKFTEEYGKAIKPSEDGEINDSRFGYSGFELQFYQREYCIPVVNRGQEMVFSYLNEPTSDEDPDIKLEILHKGIKCKCIKKEN